MANDSGVCRLGWSLCLTASLTLLLTQSLRQYKATLTTRSLRQHDPPSCLPRHSFEEMIALPPVTPIFTASYPGSGSKLTWRLIRAVTGRLTGDDIDHDGTVEKGQVVAVKTHYPSITSSSVFFAPKLQDIRLAILVLRNPLDAIPSFHNWNFEQQHGMEEHSTRAPTIAWIKWRNEHFEKELLAWTSHFRYWVDTYGLGGRLHLVAFERLISKDEGVDELARLSDYLAASHPDIDRYMMRFDRLPCVWQTVVEGNGSDALGESYGRHHRTGGYNLGSYPYTEDQLESTIHTLQHLHEEYASRFPQLQGVLTEYIRDCDTMIKGIMQLTSNSSNEPTDLQKSPSWEQELLEVHPLLSKLINVDKPVAKSNYVIPYYWYIDQSGEKNMKHILSCLGRTQNKHVYQLQCSSGSEGASEACNYQGMTAVNVDLSSTAGIQRAHELNLTGQASEDFVLVSSRFHEGMTLFTSDIPGRLFILFRNPIERAVGNYFPTFYRTGQKLSMLEYATSPHSYSNSMTRMLVDKAEGELLPNHLVLAKKILKTKCLVLLHSEMTESVDRLAGYFHWPLTDDQRSCAQRYSVEEPINALNPYTDKIPFPKSGSAEWEAFRQQNLFDLELYEYAQQIFREQSHLLSETDR